MRGALRSCKAGLGADTKVTHPAVMSPYCKLLCAVTPH